MAQEILSHKEGTLDTEEQKQAKLKTQYLRLKEEGLTEYTYYKAVMEKEMAGLSVGGMLASVD